MASARRALLKKSNSPDTSRNRWKDVVAGVEFEKRIESERMGRTRSLLQSINHAAASAVLPGAEISEQERAVIVCQKHVRAKLARKEFASRLYQRFMEDEQAREEKQREQMEEAEILLAMVRMETEAEDASSVSANRQRRLGDAATRIQRAWRRHHGYEYMETYDWQEVRANPFSSVVPVATVSAFSSPSHQQHAADESSGSGEDGGAVARFAAVAVASGPSIHQQYANEDWDMTPGGDTVTEWRIEKLEAELHTFGQTVEDLPGILAKCARDDRSSGNSDANNDSRSSGEYGYEDEDRSDSGGGDNDDEEQLRYRPRSFEQKSLSMADIRRTSLDKGDAGMTTAVASRGDAAATAGPLSPHCQSAGDLYQICYDSESSRRGKLGSLGQSTSSEGSAASFTGRRSPDGSSGHPTPVHEVADQSKCDADQHVDRAKLHMQLLPPPERRKLDADDSRIPAVASSAATATATATATAACSSRTPAGVCDDGAESRFESEVLGSRWYQRRLTAAHLHNLSGAQLLCIAEEFKRLVSISSNELVRQLEIRDERAHTRDVYRAKEEEWRRQYQKKVDGNKEELLNYGRAASDVKGKSGKRFGIFSRKSK